MPETTIGIFPDVGGGRYLSRLRGRLAQFLALTGARLDGAECMRSARHPLSPVRPARRGQGADHGPAVPGRGHPRRAQRGRRPRSADHGAISQKIDRYFASDRLEDILDALDAGADEGDEWAATEAATIRKKSPMACKVSLKLLQESPYQLHFVDEMRMEYGIMVRLIHHPDFQEGVRALLIDKDNEPQLAARRARQ